MKKQFNFTIIVGLFSLFVVIYMELSWIKVNVDLQKNLIENHVGSVMQEIASEIADRVDNKTYFLNPNALGQKYSSMDSLKTSGFGSFILSAAIYFSANEIESRFVQKLLSRGLNNLRFEFAIVRDKRVVLGNVNSKLDFMDFISANNTHRFGVFQIPLEYSSLPIIDPLNTNPKHNEVLYFVLLNDFFFFLKELGYVVILFFLFTLLIIFIFYSNVSFILRQERIDTMKTSFINNMTHEFKTPIASIKLAADILKYEEIRDKPKVFEEYMDLIKQENKRMLLLVETILQNATIARGEVRMDKVYVSFTKIIEQTLYPYQITAPKHEFKIVKHFNAQEDTVLVDTIHIINAVNNILDNSFKYAKEDVPLELEIRTSNDKDFKNIILYIADNGIGIRKNNLKLVFERFYRVNKENIHNTRGFGLGLSYTRSIIEAHKGKVSLASTFGVGTVIKIELPVYGKENLQ